MGWDSIYDLGWWDSATAAGVPMITIHDQKNFLSHTREGSIIDVDISFHIYPIIVLQIQCTLHTSLLLPHMCKGSSPNPNRMALLDLLPSYPRPLHPVIPRLLTLRPEIIGPTHSHPPVADSSHWTSKGPEFAHARTHSRLLHPNN